MFRLLFVMITTVLIGLGTGYFLWGTRVARLTEALSGQTLEMDTLRARLAAPAAAAAPQEGAKPTEELHVINEGIAALRAEIADQKTLLEKSANGAAAADAPTAPSVTEVKLRADLEACNADRLDLQARCSGSVPAPSAPPAALPPPPAPYHPYGVPRQP